MRHQTDCMTIRDEQKCDVFRHFRMEHERALGALANISRVSPNLRRRRAIVRGERTNWPWW